MMISGRAIAKARRLIAVPTLLTLLGAFPLKGYTAELLAVGRANCCYCKAWEIEIGPVYGKALESRFAPLRRIGIDRIDHMSFALDEPVRYTPTFVLLDGDLEIGRIEGYLNEAAFEGRLRELLARVGNDEFKPKQSEIKVATDPDGQVRDHFAPAQMENETSYKVL